MTNNKASCFYLALSDHERKELIRYYKDVCFPLFQEEVEDDLWYGIEIGDWHETRRMFDLNVWRDDLTEEIVCTVYECDWIGDNWQTNCRHSWTLTEEIDT